MNHIPIYFLCQQNTFVIMMTKVFQHISYLLVCPHLQLIYYLNMYLLHKHLINQLFCSASDITPVPSLNSRFVISKSYCDPHPFFHIFLVSISLKYLHIFFLVLDHCSLQYQVNFQYVLV